MAQPNSNFDEILTTTLKKYSASMADNVLENNTLLRYLKQKGQVVLEDGGYSLLEGIMFDENDSFKYYSGYETLDLTRNDVLTTAEFDWKQAAVVVQVSGLEMRQNMGETRVFNRIKELVKVAEKTMANNLASALYADGSNTKQPGGLRLYVESTNTASQTSTVGGISRGTYSFWRNQAVVYASAADAADIIGRMNNMWILTKRGADVPQVIVADANYFGYYWAALQDIQRITDFKSGNSGFSSLAYYGPGGSATVEYDDQCPANTMYFLNLDYLKWKVHQDANMRVLEDRNPINQDALVRPIIWMGQMTISNCARQGVIAQQ
jgi:hypothetical protein